MIYHIVTITDFFFKQKNYIRHLNNNNNNNSIIFMFSLLEISLKIGSSSQLYILHLKNKRKVSIMLVHSYNIFIERKKFIIWSKFIQLIESNEIIKIYIILFIYISTFHNNNDLINWINLNSYHVIFIKIQLKFSTYIMSHLS